MVDISQPENGSAVHEPDLLRIVTPRALLSIDTTSGSLLHRWRSTSRRPVSVLKMYATAVSVTYLPLALAAVLSPNPLTTQTSVLRLPFLFDWNIAFLFLISFPTLVILTITDQNVLDVALHRVQTDAVMVVRGESADALIARWQPRFFWTNVTAYSLGALAGLLIGYFNYTTYVPENVGYWIARKSQLTFAGHVFLFCIFLFYSLIPVYVLRTIAISLFLRDAVGQSSLQMLPFHPDRCGGLRPVGELGLRTQYGLSVFGLNIVSLVAISFLYLNVPSSLYGLIAAAAVGYLLIGPVVFIGPLLPFRAGMLRTKAQLMGEVAVRLRVELDRLRRQLPSGIISKDDEELIDRLRKVGAVIEELPVWPFDAATLRKFLTAYVIPIVGAVAYPLAQTLISKLLTVTNP